MDPQINLDGNLFHKTCAKCSECKCQIGLNNFAKTEVDGKLILLCKTHYMKQFSELGGAYLGGERFQVKSTRDIQATARYSMTPSLQADIKSMLPSTQDSNGNDLSEAPTTSVKERIASIRLTEMKAGNQPIPLPVTAKKATPTASTNSTISAPVPEPPAITEDSAVSPPAANTVDVVEERSESSEVKTTVATTASESEGSTSTAVQEDCTTPIKSAPIEAGPHPAQTPVCTPADVQSPLNLTPAQMNPPPTSATPIVNSVSFDLSDPTVEHKDGTIL